MKTRALTYDAARALPVYPRYPSYVLGILVLATVVTAVLGVPWVPEHALLLLLLLGIPVTGWWLWREVFPSQTTNGVITRRGDREQRAGGVASVWDVLERASRGALRRRAGILRPSLGRPRWWHDFDPTTVGVLVSRTGFGLRWGQQLWSACEDTTLRVGGPRTGKTLSLAAHGVDAPGALLTTSTRLDLAEHVHQVRRVIPETVKPRRTWRTAWLTSRPDWTTGQERAVHVFNPTGYGDVGNTVRWSILDGCRDYLTAVRRCGDLIPANDSKDGENWDRKARLYLPILLYAAAVSGRSVSDVVRWVAEIGQDSTVDSTRRELVSILVNVPDSEDLLRTLGMFLALNDRTRSSITGMMAPALGWMADPMARSIGAAALDTITLDVPRFIRERETLHIIGPDQAGGPLAPLTSALVAEVAYQARQIAGTMPGGRLDPPLTMLLDEAAVTVHLPLDEWSADMGGRGITLHMSVQSLSQLHQCWGDSGAGTLLGNVGTLLLFGGGKDAGELRKVSLLCGEKWRRVVKGGEDVDGDGEKWQNVGVLTVAQLSNMPPGQAACLQRNLGGVFVGWPPQVIDRRKRGWVSVPLDSPMPIPEQRRTSWWDRRPKAAQEPARQAAESADETA
jgi:type IV secretion system protein VirD4